VITVTADQGTMRLQRRGKLMKQRWEYKVIETANAKTKDLEEQLSSAGKEGWELASATEFYNKWMTKVTTRLFLKRPTL
jgi:hypothetical protein